VGRYGSPAQGTNADARPGDAAPIHDPALQGVSLVGVAYFLTAVLAPLFLLMSKGQAFAGYTSSGAWWSSSRASLERWAHFGVVLAFGARGTPSVVMSLVSLVRR